MSEFKWNLEFFGIHFISVLIAISMDLFDQVIVNCDPDLKG